MGVQVSIESLCLLVWEVYIHQINKHMIANQPQRSHLCCRPSGSGVGKLWSMVHKLAACSFVFSFSLSLSLFFLNDFYFFRYSWCTVSCPFSTAQQSDPVTRICIHSFSHIIPHQAPSHVTGYSSLCDAAGSHCLSTPEAIVSFFFLFPLGHPTAYGVPEPGIRSEPLL